MNDAPMKQHDHDQQKAKDQDATTETPAELPEPHFDDLAILVAQPVEPIARGKDWFAWLEKPRMMIAILVVAGLLGTTALALTFQLQRQPEVDAAATKADESEIKADESTSQPKSQLGAIAEQLKASPPRQKNRRARTAETSGDSKPVARRVGVIVYGSSSDRP